MEVSVPRLLCLPLHRNRRSNLSDFYGFRSVFICLAFQQMESRDSFLVGEGRVSSMKKAVTVLFQLTLFCPFQTFKTASENMDISVQLSETSSLPSLCT